MSRASSAVTPKTKSSLNVASLSWSGHSETPLRGLSCYAPSARKGAKSRSAKGHNKDITPVGRGTPSNSRNRCCGVGCRGALRPPDRRGAGCTTIRARHEGAWAGGGGGGSGPQRAGRDVPPPMPVTRPQRRSPPRKNRQQTREKRQRATTRL